MSSKKKLETATIFFPFRFMYDCETRDDYIVVSLFLGVAY